MTPNETAQLIAYIASRLGRASQPNPMMVEAWHEDLRHIDYMVAKAAARRITSSREVITVHIGHLLAEVRDAQRPPADEFDAVLAQCDQWYRLTDDCTHPPARDDNSLAARVYRRAGGYTALHHPQWYIKRLSESYASVVEEDRHRDLVDPDRALTVGAHAAVEGILPKFRGVND